MIAYAILTVLGILSCVESIALARVLTNKDRQSARERDLLINQIMHLSNKTWTPPPSETEFVEPPEPFDESRYLTNFDQVVEEELIETEG